MQFLCSTFSARGERNFSQACLLNPFTLKYPLLNKIKFFKRNFPFKPFSHKIPRRSKNMKFRWNRKSFYLVFMFNLNCYAEFNSKSLSGESSFRDFTHQVTTKNFESHRRKFSIDETTTRSIVFFTALWLFVAVSRRCFLAAVKVHMKHKFCFFSSPSSSCHRSAFRCLTHSAVYHLLL